MQKMTAEWVKKAEGDYLAAHKLLHVKPLLPEQICFLCQQAVEKYLKAMLQELGLPIKRTHDITYLLDQLIHADSTWKSLRRGTKTLTRYAVEYRYPVLYATSRQARAAHKKAVEVRQEVRRCLAI